ncbi:MAG TPA: hypothetical protein VK988_15160 [Acidimicrobiales bacterium]|nr:hypothetical protein [Acidimicrobiales bacterium]
MFGERPLRRSSTIQSPYNCSTVALVPVWRPLLASTSSSARAFFASLDVPRKILLTWRRFPVTGSRPASTMSSQTPGDRSLIPGVLRLPSIGDNIPSDVG